MKKLYKTSNSCGLFCLVIVRKPHPIPFGIPNIDLIKYGNMSCSSLVVQRSIISPSSGHLCIMG